MSKVENITKLAGKCASYGSPVLAAGFGLLTILSINPEIDPKSSNKPLVTNDLTYFTEYSKILSQKRPNCVAQNIRNEVQLLTQGIDPLEQSHANFSDEIINNRRIYNSSVLRNRAKTTTALPNDDLTERLAETYLHLASEMQMSAKLFTDQISTARALLDLAECATTKSVTLFLQSESFVLGSNPGVDRRKIMIN